MRYNFDTCVNTPWNNYVCNQFDWFLICFFFFIPNWVFSFKMSSHPLNSRKKKIIKDMLYGKMSLNWHCVMPFTAEEWTIKTSKFHKLWNVIKVERGGSFKEKQQCIHNAQTPRNSNFCCRQTVHKLVHKCWENQYPAGQSTTFYYYYCCYWHHKIANISLFAV